MEVRVRKPTHHQRHKTREQRFWEKVDKRGPDECWPWRACKDEKGYGHFNSGAGGSILAHRFSYELLVGPIPKGLTIDHVKARGCTRKNCVNPAHLEPVTNKVNTLRSDGPTARQARQTHCKRGHEFNERNTYRNVRSGSRQCRECMKTFRKNYDDRRRT